MVRMEQRYISNEVEVLKVDESNKIVYGFAIISKSGGEDYFDVQGDHIPEDVMTEAATDFMLSLRAAKEMHVGVAKGVVVHSMPFTTDLIKALGIEGLDKSGWLIGMRCSDDEVMRKFVSKEYTGFSIGGGGTRTRAE